MGILFRSLKEAEKQTLIGLVKVFSISAVTLSATQTLSACLTAQGKPIRAVCSMAAGVLSKTALEVILLPNSAFSVRGLAIATNVCYVVTFALNLLFNLCVKTKTQGEDEEQSRLQTAYKSVVVEKRG